MNGANGDPLHGDARRHLEGASISTCATCPPIPRRATGCCSRRWGSPDIRQIDGMGGAHPLTSKIAIVSPPSRPDADVDYLFLQAVVDEPRIDGSQNCGNLLAGIGPFAIENGLGRGSGRHDRRAQSTCSTPTAWRVARIQTPGKRVRYDGDARIDGRAGDGRADPHRLPRRRGLELRRAAADRPRARHGAGDRADPDRQRHARGRDARQGFRQDRLRDAGSAGSRCSAQKTHRGHPPRRRGR